MLEKLAILSRHELDPSELLRSGNDRKVVKVARGSFSSNSASFLPMHKNQMKLDTK